MSTAYVTSSKVIECGSKGRTIPLLLVGKVWEGEFPHILSPSLTVK